MRLVGSALLSLRQSTRRASFRGGAVAAKRQALASSASAKKRLIAACAPFLYCYCSLAATTSAAFAAAPHAAMSFSTERSGDGTITVAPRNEADQSALMVICHGLGDTAEGFADVAEASTLLRLFICLFDNYCRRNKRWVFVWKNQGHKKSGTEIYELN